MNVAAPDVARRGLLTAAIMVGAMVSVLGSSTVNVVLPDIMRAFGTGVGSIDWVITSYMLAMVAAMPLTGFLAQTLGERNAYLLGLATFALGSLGGGVVPSFTWLLVFRALQGAGAGLLMPTGQTILFSAYPPEQRGSAMGLYGLGAILGPALGPTVGGWLAGRFGWRSLFWLSVPFTLVTALLLVLAMRGRRPARIGGFDLPGFALLTATLVSMQLVLGRGSTHGWLTPLHLGLLAVATGCGFLFARRSLRIPKPLVDLRVFTNGAYARGTFLSTILGLGLYGGSFMVPLYLGSAAHHSALEIGLIMLPGSLVMGACMLASGPLARRFSVGTLIVGGIVVFALSFAAYVHLDPSAGAFTYAWPLVLRGIGVGIVYAPMSVAALGALPGPQLAQGSSLYNLTRQLGGTVGIALLKTILAGRIAVHAARLGGASVAATVHGFEDAFAIAAVLVAACLIPAWQLRAPADA